MQKKYIIYIATTIMIFLLLGVGIMSNKKDDPKKNLEFINGAYENLINQPGEVEYVKVTEVGGSYEEIYQDLKTGVTQTDRYDENNNLEFRNIFDGKTSTVISKEDGNYEGYIEKLAPEIVEENKSLPITSLIETMYYSIGENYLRGQFKLNKSGNSGSFVYESNVARVYINKESKMITKIEKIDSYGESIEYSKLKKDEKDLFKINSKNNSNVDLSKVKLKEYTQEFEGDIKNAVG